MNIEKMAKKTVACTTQNNLCISCGLCRNICCRGAIEYKRTGGKFLPWIDKTRCIKCGLCAEICPGLEMSFPEKERILDSVFGNILASYNAWSADPVLRHVSASGGVVSSIVERLLKNGDYDAAFCVSGYNYENQLQTEMITRDLLPVSWDDSTFPKSRYLPVSHEKAVAYIRENPVKRIILIGNSCAIQGFRKLIRRLSLDTSHYLLIGLFCDKVFNYNVNDYYQRRFAPDKKIIAIHFKNKESGGWPGNMKLFFKDGSSIYLDKSERVKLKNYFMPERCLYCIDKLNVEADLSVGDNYTGQNASPLGSNSVLIRTGQGETAWKTASSNLVFEPIDPVALQEAQYLDGRINNLFFSELKRQKIQKETGISIRINRGVRIKKEIRDYEFTWKQAVKKLHSGEVYLEDPDELYHQFILEQKRKNPRNPMILAERFVNGIKRRVRKIGYKFGD